MGKGKRNRFVRKQEEHNFVLSAPQRKAMLHEINAQILEHDKEYWLDMDACVLWVLHSCFGFGAIRLKKFFDAFSTEHKRLRNFYELDDDRWLCRHLLKRDLGIDIEAWEKESEQKDLEDKHDD